MAVLIRAANNADVKEITQIYAEQVAFGTGSFEIVPPLVDEMSARMKATISDGFPYLVLEEDGKVMGFAYAGPLNKRAAYSLTVEDSIYLHKDARGKGLGKKLLQALIDDLTQNGFRQIVTIIGGSDNAGSIGVHAACGFEMIGTLKGVGRKHGKWIDSVYMQRALGAGDQEPIV